MLLACVHRVVHHDDSDRLIWLYDIHLLAHALDEPGWRHLVDAATAARVRAVVRASLAKTRQCLETDIPDDVMRALEGGLDEPTASYLGRGRRQIAIEWLNVRAPGWTARLSLVRQHLLPEPAYVLAKYGRANRAWLPLLYARRMLEGAPLAARPPAIDRLVTRLAQSASKPRIRGEIFQRREEVTTASAA